MSKTDLITACDAWLDLESAGPWRRVIPELFKFVIDENEITDKRNLDNDVLTKLERLSETAQDEARILERATTFGIKPEMEHLVNGCVRAVLAANELVGWNSANDLSKKFVTSALLSASAYHAAWGLDDQRVEPPASVTGSSFRADASMSLATIAMNKLSSVDESALPQALLEQTKLRQGKNIWHHLTRSSWLSVRHLLDSILSDSANESDTESTEEELTTSTNHRVDARMLLCEAEKGFVRRLSIHREQTGQFACYLDPLSVSSCVVDGSTLNSIRLGWLVSSAELRTLLRDRSTEVMPALRIEPDLKNVAELRGGSAGGLIACCLLAAGLGEQLDFDASASFALELDPAIKSAQDIDASQIRITKIGEKSIQPKLKAAADDQIRRVVLLDKQSKLATDEGWQPDHLITLEARNLQQAYKHLTGDAAKNRTLREYCAAIAKVWTELEEKRHPDHRFDLFQFPELGLMPEGVSPYHRAGRDLQPKETEAELASYQRIASDGENRLLDFLAEGNWICATEDAGAGKSVISWRAQDLFCRAASWPRFFGGNAPLVVRFEGKWPTHNNGHLKVLKTALQDELVDKTKTKTDSTHATDTVTYALENGRVVLILDALDQFNDDHRLHLESQLTEFALFSDCRVLLTSRPYKVRHEQEFFAKGRWRYGSVMGFLEPQQQDGFFKNDGTRDAFREMVPNRDQVADLLPSPLVLRMIQEIIEDCRLSDQKPPTFTRIGDLHAEVTTRLLKRAIGKEDVKYADEPWADQPEMLDDLRKAISTVAFEMLIESCREPQQREDITAIPERLISKFLRSAERRFMRNVEPHRLDQTVRRWDRAIEILKKIEFRNPGNLAAFNAEYVSFRSLKTMEFYTGLYLASFAKEECQAEVTGFTNDVRWYWPWRFAIEMPEQARLDDEILCSSLAKLFEQPESGRRPTELIYRCWELFEPASLPGASEVVERFRDGSDQAFAKSFGKAAKFVPCPGRGDPAEFLLGSPDGVGYDAERPQVKIQLTSFQMQCTPVTRAQYQCFERNILDGDTSYGTSNKDLLANCSPDVDCPMITVTWYDGFVFSKWLGSRFRLPTEAEWEFACRANSSTRWSFSDDEKQLDDYAWWHGNSKSQTHVVGTKKPNGWGIYDMHGNVREWCQDWFSADTYGTYKSGERDPRGPAFGSSRVLRGGSFGFVSGFCRSAFRFHSEPVSVYHSNGFRVVRV